MPALISVSIICAPHVPSLGCTCNAPRKKKPQLRVLLDYGISSGRELLGSICTRGEAVQNRSRS